MIWAAVALFAAVGIAVVLQRAPIARAESMIAGGTVPPGCVTVQGALLIAIGLLFLLLLRS